MDFDSLNDLEKKTAPLGTQAIRHTRTQYKSIESKSKETVSAAETVNSIVVVVDSSPVCCVGSRQAERESRGCGV